MNISKNINCLHEFQKGLEMLLLENSKEIIERLTDIAISYDQFSPDFLQMIIRYFNKVQNETSNINLLYLIDSICKTGPAIYQKTIETFITGLFTKVYLSTKDEDLKRALKILRMSWRKNFSEGTLEAMKIQIFGASSEDVESGLSLEERKKLKMFYEKMDTQKEKPLKRKSNINNFEASPENEPRIRKKKKQNEEEKMSILKLQNYHLPTPTVSYQNNIIINAREIKPPANFIKSAPKNAVNLNTNESNNASHINKLKKISDLKNINSMNLNNANNMNNAINMNTNNLNNINNTNNMNNINNNANHSNFNIYEQKMIPINHSYDNYENSLLNKHTLPESNTNVIPQINHIVYMNKMNNPIRAETEMEIEPTPQVVQPENNKQDVEKIKKILKVASSHKENGAPLFFFLMFKYFKDNYEASEDQTNKKDVQLSALKNKNSFAIDSLYSDLKFKCNSCGTRVSQKEDLLLHLDNHFEYNKRVFEFEKKQRMKERDQFYSVEEWLKVDSSNNTRGREGSFVQETEHYIPAQEKFKKCPLCEGEFILKWHALTQNWVYESAVYVEIEEDSKAQNILAEPGRKILGFHYDCYRILLSQQEESEDLNSSDVNILKKIETQNSTNNINNF